MEADRLPARDTEPTRERERAPTAAPARVEAAPTVVGSEMLGRASVGAQVQLRTALAQLVSSASAAAGDAGEDGSVRSALQRRLSGLGGPLESASAHRVAASGVASASGALPHLGAIQASFGPDHDVSGVRASVGGAGAEASAALGARGYTYGDRVAFPSQPDLHTAAHEAAHVVQQRAGISLKGGVGAAGDVFERHADAVADRVVSGQSAADLLSSIPGGAGSGAGVQRRALQLDRTDEMIADLAQGGDADRQEREHGRGHAQREEQRAATTAHAHEIRRIVRLLGAGEPAARVLGITSHWPAEVITTVWQAINQYYSSEHDCKELLWSRLQMDDLRTYPREVVAFARAMPEDWRVDRMIRLCDDSGFLQRVDEREALLALQLTAGMSAASLRRFRQHQGGSFYRRMQQALPSDHVAVLEQATDTSREEQLRREERSRREATTRERVAAGREGGDTEEGTQDERRDDFRWKLSALLRCFSSDGSINEAGTRRVHDLFAQSLTHDASGAQLHALARELEARGWIDRWIQAMPVSARYTVPHGARPFLEVLAARPPQAALEMCFQLLSTGIFNSVDSDEARLAYALIRRQPPSVQARLRQRDDGQVLARMERAMPDEALFAMHGTFGTAGTQAEADSDRASGEAYREDLSAQAAYRQMAEQLRERASQRTAMGVRERLVGMAPGIRGEIVRRLDSRGLFERIIEHMTIPMFFRDAYTVGSRDLLMARDSMRNWEHLARIHGDGGDNAILALELYRALPPAEQARLTQEHDQWIGDIRERIPPERLRDLDINIYRGGEGGSDRDSVHTQLANRELWTSTDPAQVRQLGNIVRMATAAGLRSEVLRYARDFGVAERHAALLRSVTERPEIDGRDTLAMIPEQSLSGPNGTTGARGIRLSGYMGGVEFAAPRSDEDRTNMVDAAINLPRGIADVTIPAGLRIDNVSLPAAGCSFQMGVVETGPVRAAVRWQTPDNPTQATRLDLSIASGTLNEFVLIRPNGILAVHQVHFEGLEIHVDELGFDASGLRSTAQAQTMMRQMSTSTLVAEALPLIGAGMNIGQVFAGMAEQELGGTGGARVSVRSIRLVGVTGSNGMHADSVEITNLGVAMDNLPSDAARTQTRQLVARIGETRTRLTELRGAAERSPADEHELARLEAALPQLQSQLETIRGRLPELDREDQRYRRIYRALRERQTVSEEDRSWYEQRRSTLRRQVAVGVGSVVMRGAGLSQGGTSETLRIDNVHAHGSGVGLTQAGGALGALADPSAILRAAQGDSAGMVSDGELSIARVRGSGIRIPMGARNYRELRDRRGLLIQQRDRHRRDPSYEFNDADEADRLDILWQTDVGGMTFGEALDQYLRLEAAGVEGRHERARMRDLRERMARVDALQIQSMDLRGISARAQDQDPDVRSVDTQVTGSVAELELTGVRRGDMSAATVTGRDVDASALLANLGQSGRPDMLFGQGAVGELSATDVNVGGNHVDRVSVQGTRVHADTLMNGGTVGASVERLDATGIRALGRRAHVEARIAEIERMDPPTPYLRRRLEELRAERQRAQDAAGALEDLRTQLQRLQGETGGSRAVRRERRGMIQHLTQQIEDMAAAVRAWEGQPLDDLHLRDVSVEATGLGNFLDPNYDPAGREIIVRAHLGNLSVGALQLGVGPVRVASESLSFEGLDVGVALQVSRGDDGEGYRLQVTRLDSVDLVGLDLTGFSLRMPVESEAVELNVPSARIRGLHARQLPVSRQFDPLDFAGSFQVAEVSARVETQIGGYFHAGATLSGSDIRVEGAETGGVAIHIGGGASLSQMGFEANSDTPRQGSLVSAVRGMHGTIRRLAVGRGQTDARVERREDGTIAFDTHLPSISVSGINLGSRNASARLRGAALNGIRMRGRAVPRPRREGESEQSAEGTPTRSLHIDLLHVVNGHADELHLRSGRGRERQSVDMRRGAFTDLRLTGFDLDTGNFDVRVGWVGLTNLRYAADAFSARTDLQCSGLRFRQISDGHQRLGFDDISGRVDLTQGDTTASVDLDGVSTTRGGGEEGSSDIDITRERIRIPNLRLGTWTLNRLNFSSPSMRVRTLERGRAVLENGSLDATVHMEDYEDRPGHRARRIRSISIPNLTIPTIRARGLAVTLNNELEIEIAPYSEGTLTRLTMAGLEITRGESGELGDIDVREAGLASARIPQIATSHVGQASRRFLTRDLRLDQLNLQRIASHGRSLDIASATLQRAQATFGREYSGQETTVIVRGAGMQGFHSDDQGMSVREAHAGFHYDDGNLELDIGRAALPDGFRMPENGPIRLPDVVLSNTRFRVRDLGRMTRGSGGGGRSSDSGAFWRQQNPDFMDTLSGQVNLDIEYHVLLPAWLFSQVMDETMHLRLPVMGGRISLDTLESQLPARTNAVTGFAYRDQYLWLEVGRPPAGTWVFRWHVGLLGRDASLARRSLMHIMTLPRVEMNETEGPAADPPSFSNLNALFTIRGPEQIRLGDGQRITLGGQGRDGMFRFTARSEGDVMSGITFAMDQLNISDIQDLRLGDDHTLSTERGGYVRIQNVSNTRLGFHHGSPDTLEGRISRARAHNLIVNRRGD